MEIWDSEEFILKEIFLIVVGGIFGLFCIVFDIIDVGMVFNSNMELIFVMKIDRVILFVMLYMFELFFRIIVESSGDYVFWLG